MKVAVVHDWLAMLTGAERVLDQVLLCYPGADVFTTVDAMAADDRRVLHGSRVIPSFIQRLPGARTNYWKYIPLMPFAVESFDLEPYDLVISCSHTVAKGILVHPHQAHVCYLMSPMRFAWDLQPLYLDAFRVGRGPKGLAARLVLHWLRLWDVASAARVDRFVANSGYVARRCQLAYRRDAAVLHSPCDLEFYTPGGAPREDFYLAASRLTPFKRLDLIVETFRGLPDRRLVVIGEGPERDRIQSMAAPNVTILGYQPDSALREYLRRARAFLFAPPEDFGIVMVEAQACGTPVIALGRGGALEIVRGLDDPRPTGVFFAEQRPELVRKAVLAFEHEASRFDAAACRENAERFSPRVFRERFVREVETALAAYAPGGRARDATSTAASPRRV